MYIYMHANSHPIPIWPLHDIAMANIVWRMAYTRGVGGRSYIAQ